MIKYSMSPENLAAYRRTKDIPVTRQQHCPGCKKRRSAAQFAPGDDLCKTCRRRAPAALEIWRACLDGYEVSNAGRVRRSKPGRNTFVGKVLRPGLASMGYLTVAPVVNGRNASHYVHELVAAAFIGPRPEGMLVNHRDTNKLNNVDSNLEYITFAGNMAHAADAGVLSHGEQHYNAKLTNEAVLALRADRIAGLSYSRLAEKYGVAISHAWQVVKGNSWRHI